MTANFLSYGPIFFLLLLSHLSQHSSAQATCADVDPYIDEINGGGFVCDDLADACCACADGNCESCAEVQCPTTTLEPTTTTMTTEAPTTTLMGTTLTGEPCICPTDSESFEMSETDSDCDDSNEKSKSKSKSKSKTRSSDKASSRRRYKKSKSNDGTRRLARRMGGTKSRGKRDRKRDSGRRSGSKSKSRSKSKSYSDSLEYSTESPMDFETTECICDYSDSRSKSKSKSSSSDEDDEDDEETEDEDTIVEDANGQALTADDANVRMESNAQVDADNMLVNGCLRVQGMFVVIVAFGYSMFVC